MSTELTNVTIENILNSYARRLEELERRVLVLGDDPTDEIGCCTVLCCNDHPNFDQATGVSHTYCAVTLEESAGDALRLAIHGFVVVSAQAAGAVQFDVGASVDGTAYLERGKHRETMASGDVVTIPVLTTVDSNATGPTVSLVVRNQDVTTIRVLAVGLQVLVYGVRDGSQACGQTAGTG